MNFAALIYHREAFLDGQWWLPFTAQLMHFNARHVLANGVGAILLCVLFRPCLGWWPQSVIVAGSAVGVALVLVLDVDCRYYAGASGALHGWAVGAAVCMLSGRPTVANHPRSLPSSGPFSARVVAWALLCGAVLKVLWTTLSPQTSMPMGFPVYAPAHWAGAIGGLSAGLGWVAVHAWVAQPAQPE